LHQGDTRALLEYARLGGPDRPPSRNLEISGGSMGLKQIMGGAVVCLSGVVVSGVGRADDCVLPANKVIVSGSTAIAPLIKATAGPLVAGDIDVYYASVGSCTGSVGFVKATDLGGKTAIHYDATGMQTP